MSFVAELEPRPLWRHFDEILRIPRGSGREQAVREHVIGVARDRGLEHEVDDTGNLLVSVPGTPGREQAPVIVLQAHLDIVEVKEPDHEHDFERDPIVPVRDGGWLMARGTTLGSDNGIGVAAMLALMSGGDAPHGPLECLFTVDEETGLTGALGLPGDLLRGRLLLNLDSEEEGELTIGCAGGGDTELRLALRAEPAPERGVALELALSGLRGGHSGIDIHLQRGNAIGLLARALHAACAGHHVRLVELRGGVAHNVIPREASALLVLAPEGAPSVTELRGGIEEALEAIRDELGPVDPDLRWRISEAELPERTWDEESSRRALRLLVALPHGAQAISSEMPGLVETSVNLAVVTPDEAGLRVLLSSRSSVASALSALRGRLRAFAGLAGAEVVEGGAYPAWRPDLDSALLATVREVHAELRGEPEIRAIHAGLECGIIGEKFPGMDMISFGPQIEFPHSPGERVRIDSVASFAELLAAVLRRLAE